MSERSELHVMVPCSPRSGERITAALWPGESWIRRSAWEVQQ
jgi:hypothetical protein